MVSCHRDLSKFLEIYQNQFLFFPFFPRKPAETACKRVGLFDFRVKRDAQQVTAYLRPNL